MLRRLSIKTRVLLVTAILIAILAGMTLFTTAKLADNARAVAETAELAELSELANQTRSAFGEYRYWLTDLAVSLLRLSEINAEAAKERLSAKLDQLGAAGPRSPPASGENSSSSRVTPRARSRNTPPTSE